jgi:hypothetical protein
MMSLSLVISAILTIFDIIGIGGCILQEHSELAPWGDLDTPPKLLPGFLTVVRLWNTIFPVSSLLMTGLAF